MIRDMTDEEIRMCNSIRNTTKARRKRKKPVIHLVDWRGMTVCDRNIEPKDGEWTSDQDSPVLTCEKCKEASRSW